MAKLLMSEQFHKKNEYYAWGGLFEFTYGKTVEDMAATYDQKKMEDVEGFAPV